MSTLKTPFRYDFVGSFLRPQALKDAKAKYQNNDITKEELQTALNVADGADVSLVQGVQVNGVDVTPDGDKKVNIAIAEGTTNGSVAVNGTDVSVKGLDTMAYQKADDYVTLDSVVLATADDLAGLFPTT